MSNALPKPAPPAQGDLRGVLAIPAFRKLWRALAFGSLGDWLGLLATTALAKQLSGNNYAKANVAIAGVFIVRLIPAVLLGPLAGVIADRFDRRRLMVTCDVLRFVLFASIPLVRTYWWLYTATVLIESVTLFWGPAKEATVPNLVPRDRLEAANQVSLLVAYGTAPIAAALFSLMALINSALAADIGFFKGKPVDIALYVDALSFAFSALTIYLLREIPKAKVSIHKASPNIARSFLDGWKFVWTTKVVRGLVVGMLGAFAAGGAVIGLARTYVGDLGGGDAAYGMLFGAVFTGLAAGMALGPKTFAGFSRKRLFGLSLAMAGFSLVLLAAIPNLVMAILIALVLGSFAGISWVSGYTMLGLEVHDEVRGRTFAFVNSLIRITLVLVLAVSPVLAAAIGKHSINIRHIVLNYNGAAFTMLLGGFVAMIVGVSSYRQMDDRKGVPLFRDLVEALRGDVGVATLSEKHGIFIAFEGGEGSGKSTQAVQLRDWFVGRDYEVVLTREPGGTDLGGQLRRLLLDKGTGAVAPRAEALLYAADRAEHVYSVVRPALNRGAVVISDRYVDSSLAYQGSGRVLPSEDVLRISRWATEGLIPDLTVLLDIPASIGLERCGIPDRLESEPLEFHERVRWSFLQLATVAPDRYLVVDATGSVDEVAELIRVRFEELLAKRKSVK
ncbi:MAG TPA: dTMP kinase [Candidatus Nanopelagicaceae bacterium]|nr:dTMP kinase [Candidatus Nanopelagicaceae bacterium]